MDISDMPIHPVVCQKSDFHGYCDFQSSQKLDALQIPAKKFTPKYASLSKKFWCKKLIGGASQKWNKI
jgi:hypothetical protein